MKVLKNPWVILASIILGIIYGILASEALVNIIAPIGEIYVALLQMCIVPIVLTAILSSVAELIRSPSVTQKVIWRFATWLIVILLLVSTLGVSLGVLVEPGRVRQEQRNAFGQIIESATIETDYGVSLTEEEQVVEEEPEGFLPFLKEIVPQNIFASLTDGEILRIVFFAILFGVAIAFIKKEQSDYIVTLSTGIYLSFNKIIEWNMYLLPVGLFSLIAKQVKSTGVSALIASIKLIITFYCLAIFVLLINTLIISIRTRKSFFSALRACLNPIFVSFSTRSSIAAIPSALEALTENLYMERLTTKFIFPLSITLGRFGNVLFFSLAGIFAAQLYEVSLTFGQVILVIFAAVAAGISTAGATGYATLGMIAIVVRGLGLPIETLVLILFAIDPIIDPMRSLLIVHTNIMFTTLVTSVSKNKRSTKTQEPIEQFSSYAESHHES